MALSFSRVLDLSFKRIQFTPDVTPSDVVGFTMYDSGKQEFVFKPGAVMSNSTWVIRLNKFMGSSQ
ncbi:AAA family ATPase [Vagococcus jeotgali]|uniref:AAA family ATPase n=1 Tax=Vagococcus jeotgali TaxID=3109030 RepID=UPI002DDC81EB|nr:AAA family ATPase [Vagococcus sp. B2T-5]